MERRWAFICSVFTLHFLATKALIEHSVGISLTSLFYTSPPPGFRDNIMIISKKLVRMAMRWQNIDGISIRKISPPGSPKFSTGGSTASSGNFAVYTTDGKRFFLPLDFLNNNIFLNLLKWSEEEFGISSSGHIMMPCESSLMNYIVLLVQRGLGKDSEQALLSVIASNCSSMYTSLTQECTGHELLACS